MAFYTTGEIAKLCGVSVRTVQYYDTRGILSPDTLSEGGRRLYTDDDVRRLRIICYLREMGMSISAIQTLFEEEHPETVMTCLLEEQRKTLEQERQENERKRQAICLLQNELKRIDGFSVDTLGDIALLTKKRPLLRRVHIVMLIVGFLMDAVEVAAITLWVCTGQWIPAVIGLVVAVFLGVWISVFYTRRTVYLCPCCHRLFKPRFRESFFAKHTPKTRRLTCPHCYARSMCVETYGTKEEYDAEA